MKKVTESLGLELGADDYITKPFSPREVVLRINAVLRRLNASNQPEEENQIETHGVVIDLDRHQVFDRRWGN